MKIQMQRAITWCFYIAYCLLFIAYSFIHPKLVWAAGEFQADYDVQYAVSPIGTTIVTQKVTLTNKQTNLYPQKYSIIIDSEKIQNVIAYDNGGIVSTQISQRDGKTEIKLPFNEKVVGLGKKLHFSLRYENTDIAVQNGNIWEVNIPGVAEDPDIASYNVSLQVPPTFGENAYISPIPAVGSRWTKEQMVKGGITAAYGTNQVFDVMLSYFLENMSVAKKKEEISLPPDTSLQTVLVHSIEPKPKTVLSDVDGNWLAQYELMPGQKLEILVKATIVISMRPKSGSETQLSDKKLYTRTLPYWEATNPRIQDLAKKYTTPRDIYTYVVNTLSYDYNRVSQSPARKGAVGALDSPQNSICMEFTDLFIAIARAAGIPAREVVGYAYTTNAKLRPLSLVSDVLHAWPEYYDEDQKLWIGIDPTWAKTTGGVNYFDKLDFNHIALSIHGISSDYPYPAGFYKKSGQNSKDVLVQFGKNIPGAKGGKLLISYVFPNSVSSGFTASGSVIVENTGGVALPSATVSVRSIPIDVAITEQLQSIPPYAKFSLPISIALPSYFLSGKGTITTTVNGESKQFYFDIVPFSKKFILPLVTLTIVIISYALLWKYRKK